MSFRQHAIVSNFLSYDESLPDPATVHQTRFGFQRVSTSVEERGFYDEQS